MASAICTSFKQEILQGIHLAAHTYKIALFTSAATLGAGTTAYSATNEVANGNGYTTGGLTLSGFTTSASGTTAWIDWTTDPSWAVATFTARYAVIYNSSASDKAVAVIDFDTDKTASAGTFLITLPAADASNAIIRIT